MRSLDEVLNKVLLGRCEDVLREIPDHSVDCVLTDAPYGLGKEPSPEEIDRFLSGESGMGTLKKGPKHCINSILRRTVVPNAQDIVTESGTDQFVPFKITVHFASLMGMNRVQFQNQVQVWEKEINRVSSIGKLKHFLMDKLNTSLGEGFTNVDFSLRESQSSSGCVETCSCFTAVDDSLFALPVRLSYGSLKKSVNLPLEPTIDSAVIPAILTLNIRLLTGELCFTGVTDQSNSVPLFVSSSKNVGTLSGAGSTFSTLEFTQQSDIISVTDSTFSFNLNLPRLIFDRFHFPLESHKDFLGADWQIPPVGVWKEALRVVKPGGYVASFAGCYDSETEVLTKDGWVKFPNVTGREMFASLNLESHIVEWQKAKEVVKQPHNGPMLRYLTNKVDLVVTPNHKMVVAHPGRRRNGTRPKYKLIRADSHSDRVNMLKTSNGREDTTIEEFFTLPAVMQTTSWGHQIEIPEKKIPLRVWLKYFGLYLAEGSATITHTKGKTTKGYNSQICHTSAATVKHLQRILKPWFDVKLYTKGDKLRINSKQLVTYLKQFGKAWEKFIPDWIKALPSKYLKIFWDWYMRGDGHGTRVAYTSSPRLRDDLQEIAMYMGISADWYIRKPKTKKSRINGREIHERRPHYEVVFNSAQSWPEVSTKNRNGGRNRNIVREVIPSENWNGDTVYCVELEQNHTLYVRRRGKAVWCGNTRTFDLFDAAMRAAGLTDEDTFMSKFGCNIMSWIHSQGFPKSLNVGKALTQLGELELAEKYKSYGTQLKPSWEPILIFRTPGPRFHRAETDVPFFYAAKVSKREANLKDEAECIENTHPTRKSLKLMKRLLELTTPQGGTVLDMYCGSGSTLHAAQELGMNFIGIEMDPVFHKIASDRTRIIGERLERDRAQMAQDLLSQAQEEGPSAIENALFDLAMSDE